jgi:hypothetical protein
VRARWWWWWFSVLSLFFVFTSARGYPLSGVGRGARAGYAAFIFDRVVLPGIFLRIANFPLEFTSKLTTGDQNILRFYYPTPFNFPVNSNGLAPSLRASGGLGACLVHAA